MRNRPLVIGVLAAGPLSLNQRRRDRLRLAAFAHSEGFALLETFELGINGLRDDVAAGGLISLTQRHDVEAIVTSGAVDVERLKKLDIPEDLRFVSVAG